MKSLFKLFIFAGALFSCVLMPKSQTREAFAEETILNKKDFTFNVKYSQDEYNLSLDFVSNESANRYENYTLEYKWNVSSVDNLESVNNTCSFLDSEGKDYVYTVNIIVSIESEENESISFNKFLQNGKEVLITVTETEEQRGFFLLPYFYIPILAAILGIGYLVCFKTNRLVGSLESTSEKLSSLLLYKEKFDKVLKTENIKDNKKKKQIYRLLFKVRGHLYSIRYIIENMSMDISINNTEILDECNTVINNLNTIDKKKHSIEELTSLVNNLFEHDLTQLANLSKKMLSTQKKYLETTYGKK